MGKLRLSVLLFWSCLSSQAQELTLHQYLKSALNDGYYKSFSGQDMLLQNKSTYSLPWINKVQALYQDNQFNNYQTRYTLRFYPGNPFQIQSNNRYFQGYQVLKTLEQKLVLKEILEDRYNLAVEFWIASEREGLAQEQKNLQEKIEKTMQQLAGSSQFDADDYINIQLNVVEKVSEWQEAVLERNIAQSKILVNGTETNFILPPDLISVDQINQLMESTGKPERTEYNFLKQQAEVSGLRTKLEKSNFDLGYLQAMYGSDRRLGGENSIGLAFGVSLPIINQNKEDVTRQKLNTIERQGELDQYLQEESNKVQHAKNNLHLHLSHYQKVDSLIQSVREKKMNLISALSSNYNPIIELKYQDKLLQLDLLRLKIKKQILLQYIVFLTNQDKLHERPLVNYLSKNLENLEN